ncbi:5300_t:CDS:1, partial [Scutellospora calospora]
STMPVQIQENCIIDDINPSNSMEDMIKSKTVSMRPPYVMTSDSPRRQNAKSECDGNRNIMIMNEEEESNEVIDGINYSSTTRHSLNSSLSSLPRRTSVLDISSLLCELPSTSPVYDSSIDGDSSMDDISTTSQLGDTESLDSPRSCHNTRVVISTPDTSPPLSPSIVEKDEKLSTVS